MEIPGARPYLCEAGSGAVHPSRCSAAKDHERTGTAAGRRVVVVLGTFFCPELQAKFMQTKRFEDRYYEMCLWDFMIFYDDLWSSDFLIVHEIFWDDIKRSDDNFRDFVRCSQMFGCLFVSERLVLKCGAIMCRTTLRPSPTRKRERSSKRTPNKCCGRLVTWNIL